MSRFIDNGDGTILDTQTKLTWQKDTPEEYFTFDQAKKYAESLDLAGKGWRVPTRIELIGIVDHDKCNPCISEVFGRTFTDWYWSSTLFQPSPSSYAWGVSFSIGYSISFGITSNNRVRCVR